MSKMGATIVGYTHKGLNHLRGRLIYPNGNWYGTWNNNSMNVIQEYAQMNGHKYEGQLENRKSKHFKMTSMTSGGRFNGIWNHGSKYCFGSSNDGNNGKYEGEYKNGKREGKGTLIYPNGNKYEGEFKNG